MLILKINTCPLITNKMRGMRKWWLCVLTYLSLLQIKWREDQVSLCWSTYLSLGVLSSSGPLDFQTKKVVILAAIISGCTLVVLKSDYPLRTTILYCHCRRVCSCCPCSQFGPMRHFSLISVQVASSGVQGFFFFQHPVTWFLHANLLWKDFIPRSPGIKLILPCPVWPTAMSIFLILRNPSSHQVIFP